MNTENTEPVTVTTRTLILKVQVHTNDEDLTEKPAAEFAEMLRESLPSAWFTDADGDPDLWLTDYIEGHWADEFDPEARSAR